MKKNAINFHREDIHGQDFSLDFLKGEKVLLSFYRYVHCPFCNLRLRQLMERSNEYQAKGLKIVVVFESSKESILSHSENKQLPFITLADPERELYKLYGLKESWLGLAFSLLRLKDIVEIMRRGLLRFQPENAIAQLPADFLINENFLLSHSYYARDIGDHIPFEIIEAFIQSKN